MQYVEVDRRSVRAGVRLATVQMHTAAAASDARIPGLPAAEAARLPRPADLVGRVSRDGAVSAPGGVPATAGAVYAERQAAAGLGGSWQRLHPLSPFVRAGRGVAGIVVLLLIPTSGGGKGGVASDAVHVGILVVFVLLASSRAGHQWRVQDGVLLVESGLIRRTSERFR